jgi:hypothetical protein
MTDIEERPNRDDGPAGAETVVGRRFLEPPQSNAPHRESQPFPSDDELYVEVCRAARDVTESDRDWLEEHGVTDRKLADWGDLGAAHVQFHDRYYEPADDGPRAFITRVADWGGTADLIAWLPSRPGAWGFRRGTAWALGEADFEKAEFEQAKLYVYRTPLCWLAAPDDQLKICILDWSTAWPRILGGPQLIVEDEAHAGEIRHHLRLPHLTPPRMFVAAEMDQPE